MRADVLDDASELEEQERLGAMAKLVASREPTPPDFDGIHCQDCGEEVEEARREAGRFRCFECQTAHEQRAKLFRK